MLLLRGNIKHYQELLSNNCVDILRTPKNNLIICGQIQNSLIIKTDWHISPQTPYEPNQLWDSMIYTFFLFDYEFRT